MIKSALTFWGLRDGVWMQFPDEPQGKCTYYRRFQPEQGRESVWRYCDADGCDNPGVKSHRVDIDELPPELLLTLALLEIKP